MLRRSLLQLLGGASIAVLSTRPSASLAPLVTKMGIVTYEGESKPIRKIYPIIDDSEIAAELCPCGCGDLHWIGHLDRARNPILQIVPAVSLQMLT